jgi:shikimate kinase
MTARVVLVGMPGAGKTSTGKRLAKILALPFADSDELVEAATGRTVAELFADDGEAAFRVREAAAVADGLRTFDGVLALGGGAVLAAATRDAIRDAGAAVVLLRADLPTLAQRVAAGGSSRPLLNGDPLQRLEQLSAERAAFYAELATLVVDTDGRTPAQVASHIAAELHRAGVLS